MEDIVLDVVIFDVIHQVSSVTFDLLRGSDGAEDDFCEALTGEHPEADPTDGSPIFHKG